MSKLPPGPNDYMMGVRTLARMKADVLGTYTALHEQYGDAVSFRTGPYRLFLFFHHEQAKQVLVTHAKSLIRLPRVMQTLAQWNGDSLLIAEGKPWIRQRRLVQPAFQPRRLEAYGRTMVASARALVDSWRSSMERDGHLDVDIDKAMTQLTLSIICRTMFDTDVSESSDEVSKAVATLSEVAFHEMQAMVRMPRWLPTSWNRRKRWAIDVLDQVVWRFVRERRADGRDHGDLLSMLLAAVDDEDSGGGGLDDRQVRNEAMTLMLGGHDTTAAGMDWLWYNLARFPDVAARCQEEIEQQIGARDPAASHIEQLPYLVATIKETLRLYPPAIGIFLRQATTDLEIGGYEVPKNSLIGLSSYITHRDARWFDEPEQFRPERFLPDADAFPAGAYFPFGGGPRVCIGQGFAMAEMALVAATMLQSCRITTVPGEAEPILHVTMALRPKDRLLLRWSLRGGAT